MSQQFIFTPVNSRWEIIPIELHGKTYIFCNDFQELDNIMERMGINSLIASSNVERLIEIAKIDEAILVKASIVGNAIEFQQVITNE